MSFKKWMLLITLGLVFLPVWAQDDDEDEECNAEPDTRMFTHGFSTDDCKFRTRYFSHENPNAYWIMEPGWRIVLEGVEEAEEEGEEDEEIRVEITVLNETEMVAGVRTRVIEEREWIDGELFEVSRNFYAICKETNDVYYFGEDVDFYEDGEIVDHHGEWRVGVNDAEPGVIMPGTIMLGARFYQEYSPEEALDRAEIIDMGTVEVGDEAYENAVIFQETNPLEEDPCDMEIKCYAPGIGVIKDEALELVEAGFVFRAAPLVTYKD